MGCRKRILRHELSFYAVMVEFLLHNISYSIVRGYHSVLSSAKEIIMHFV